MFLDSTPYRESLICKRILLKKITIMHGKGDFSKIKGSICYILIEAAKISSNLSRLKVSNELIVVKLKRDVKLKGSCVFRTSSPTYYAPSACLYSCNVQTMVK